MVLHEASHKIFGSRWGTVTLELTAACEGLGVEMPRELWHALSFYTSGAAVARIAHAAGEVGFDLDEAVEARLVAEASRSLQAQADIEAADDISFEQYLANFYSQYEAV